MGKNGKSDKAAARKDWQEKIDQSGLEIKQAEYIQEDDPWNASGTWDRDENSHHKKKFYFLQKIQHLLQYTIWSHHNNQNMTEIQINIIYTV